MQDENYAAHIKLSILDHFLMNDRDKKKNVTMNSLDPLQNLYRSVQRDLEYLLNTRRPHFNWPNIWKHLDQSLLSYGISDVTAKILDAQKMQKNLCVEWSHIIKKFEPRLKEVEVSLLPILKPYEHTLHLKIEALLIYQTLWEPIVFDSVFDAENNQFQIKDVGR